MFLLSTVKLEWTVGGLISKDSASLSMGQNLRKFAWLPLTCLTTKSISDFLYLFILGIRRGNVTLGPKIGNFEVQMIVTFK